MRRKTTLLGAILVLALPAVGTANSSTTSAPQLKAASCAGAISWTRARSMVGRVATIKGRVAGTFYASSSNGSPTFLNVGVDHPNRRRLTVVIWGSDRSRFGRPEVRYRGRTICARGVIETYQGIPQIKASSPGQIKVAG